MRALFRGVQLMLMMRARIMRISGPAGRCQKVARNDRDKTCAWDTPRPSKGKADAHDARSRASEFV